MKRCVNAEKADGNADGNMRKEKGCDGVNERDEKEHFFGTCLPLSAVEGGRDGTETLFKMAGAWNNGKRVSGKHGGKEQKVCDADAGTGETWPEPVRMQKKLYGRKSPAGI
jgi:hypothetical protein